MEITARRAAISMKKELEKEQSKGNVKNVREKGFSE